MAARTLPGLGLSGFWGLGEDGWNTGMDDNLLLLSVLVQGAVASRTSDLPGSPVEGDVYITKSDHGTNPLEVAVYDDSQWKYFVPNTGWNLFVEDDGEYVFWDGDSWEINATTGGGVSDVIFEYALSDETTAITVGTKLTSRLRVAGTMSELPRISLTTESSSGVVEVDILKNGSTIFTTTVTIDANEKTSVTAAIPAVLLSDPISWTDDDEVSFSVESAGTGATGLKVSMKVTPS